jgi:hypothetical protein
MPGLIFLYQSNKQLVCCLIYLSKPFTSKKLPASACAAAAAAAAAESAEPTAAKSATSTIAPATTTATAAKHIAQQHSGSHIA